MSDLEAALAANRAAAEGLLAAAERCADRWTTPRAPGKWSPSQLVEHVARSLEQAGNVIAGRPHDLPRLPAFLRPLGKLVFKRMLRTDSIPKSKTTKLMDPIEGPATLADARVRVDGALAKFEAECRAHSDRRVNNPAFGRIRLEDYVRFAALHTRHHTAQMPS